MSLPEHHFLKREVERRGIGEVSLLRMILEVDGRVEPNQVLAVSRNQDLKTIGSLTTSRNLEEIRGDPVHSNAEVLDKAANLIGEQSARLLEAFSFRHREGWTVEVVAVTREGLRGAHLRSEQCREEQPLLPQGRPEQPLGQHEILFGLVSDGQAESVEYDGEGCGGRPETCLLMLEGVSAAAVCDRVATLSRVNPRGPPQPGEVLPNVLKILFTTPESDSCGFG